MYSSKIIKLRSYWLGSFLLVLLELELELLELELLELEHTVGATRVFLLFVDFLSLAATTDVYNREKRQR